jgi:predicted metal-dependent HD superfamily phosphohydrolase
VLPAALDTPAARVALDAARAMHLEPPRAYHDFTHVEACLRGWTRFRDAWARPAEAFWAFVYHDAIYVPVAHDNELRSAEAARCHLAGLPGLDLGVVCALIEKTALHADPRMPGLASTWHADERLFVDLDAGILGAPPDDYRRYAAAIRAEYAFVPDDLYAVGRGRFLEAMLARPRIFLTAGLEDLEPRARENLVAERAAWAAAPPIR